MGGGSSALPRGVVRKRDCQICRHWLHRPDHLSLPKLPTRHLPATVRRALLLEGMRPLPIWVRSYVLSRSVVSHSLRPHGPQPTRLFCPWDFPGKNTRVGCHFLLQGLFFNPWIEPSSPALQADSLPLSHTEKYLWMGISLDRLSWVQARSVFPWSLLLNPSTCHCSSELVYHDFLCWIFSYGDSNFPSSASGQASRTIQSVKY